MSKKVKISIEAWQKAEQIISHHGYSSPEEMIENLITNEFDKIKSGDKKEEMADKLSGLGYIS